MPFRPEESKAATVAVLRSRIGPRTCALVTVVSVGEQLAGAAIILCAIALLAARGRPARVPQTTFVPLQRIFLLVCRRQSRSCREAGDGAGHLHGLGIPIEAMDRAPRIDSLVRQRLDSLELATP